MKTYSRISWKQPLPSLKQHKRSSISTMQAFAAGDASKLKILSDAIDAPRNGRNGGYQMASNLTTLLREISRTIWSQVCLGNTSGYKESASILDPGRNCRRNAPVLFGAHKETRRQTHRLSSTRKEAKAVE